MVDGGGARAEAFFVAHRLGVAYDSVGKGWGVRKHVSTALLQAQRDDREDEIVGAGLDAYGLEPSQPTKARRASRAGNVLQISGTSRVFISHASVDKELANALADLIRLGTGLSHERILCTSLEGMGIPIGTTDYLGYLRGELSDAGLVLPLLTPAFFDSEACLIEIGAMWGLQMPAFPLLVPPVDYPRVERLLGKFQGAKINQSPGLSQLHDRIVQAFGLMAATDMWEAKKASFEEKLPGLLDSLAKGTRVSAQDLEAAKRRAAKLKSRATKLQAKVDELEEQNRSLHEAKTAGEADAAIAPNGEVARFESAAETAADAVSSLSRPVRMALYEDLGRNDYYRPERFSSEADDAKRAHRNDLLWYHEDDGGYSPNYEDPAVSEARDALTDLFDVSWSEDLKGWFRNNHRKRFAAKSLPVWEALDLV